MKVNVGSVINPETKQTADIIVAASKSDRIGLILVAIAGGAFVALAGRTFFNLGAKACAKADFDTMHKLGLC